MGAAWLLVVSSVVIYIKSMVDHSLFVYLELEHFLQVFSIASRNFALP